MSAADQPITAVDHIRLRPGMYMGNPKSRHGVATLIAEVFANVVDLFIAGKATRFRVASDSEGWITMEDDGPGLPFDEIHQELGINLVEKHFTVGHITPTADDHTPHIHMNLGGVGLLMISALSEKLEVESLRAGVGYRQKFGRGIALSTVERFDGDGADGSQIRLLPDPEIFDGGFARLDLGVMRARMFTAAHLFPGLVIEVQDERFCAVNGLGDYVDTLVSSESHLGSNQVLRFQGKTGTCHIDFACVVQSGRVGDTWVQSWANGIQTNHGGSHVSGMKRAIANAGLAPEIAAINVIVDHPNYAGPTRARLNVQEVEADVEKTLGAFFRELEEVDEFER